ncbi:MAG: sulfite exporter TauE/SafE family protein [Verrucomicrobiota bacterium]|nr:sulfite exporter TauE/SafE family protein [Verrucomicrobiota bacterium]
MFDPNQVTTTAAAFSAGLITSLHCVGMCGPLACVFGPRAGERANPVLVTGLYHGVRLIAYVIIGALLGQIGESVYSAYNASFIHYLPWALVVFFVAIAVGADRWIPKPRWLSQRVFRVTGKIQQLPRYGAAALLGSVTPFLPCGPLYTIFGIAMVMGSPWVGAQFLFAFGLGTLPLLFAAQLGLLTWRQHISPVGLRRLQQVLALSMAILIAWRLRSTIGGAGPSVDCPFCP